MQRHNCAVYKGTGLTQSICPALIKGCLHSLADNLILFYPRPNHLIVSLGNSNQSRSNNLLIWWSNHLLIEFFDPKSWNQNQWSEWNWLNHVQTVSKKSIYIKINQFYIQIVQNWSTFLIYINIYNLLIDNFNLLIDSLDLFLDLYQSFNQKEIENDQF